MGVVIFMEGYIEIVDGSIGDEELSGGNGRGCKEYVGGGNGIGKWGRNIGCG